MPKGRGGGGGCNWGAVRVQLDCSFVEPSDRQTARKMWLSGSIGTSK